MKGALNSGQLRTTQEPEKVTCGECRFFERDTEGRSFYILTGEYYMGVCCLGRTPDTPIKQFANKPRKCEYYYKK